MAGRDFRKIGDQSLKAYAALGMEEIRSLLYPGTNVAQHSTEPGMWGERSYGDVSDDRHNSESPERKSLLADKIKQVELARDGHEPERRDRKGVAK